MKEKIVIDYRRGGTQKEIYGDSEVIRRECPLCAGDDCLLIHKERGAIGIVKCKRCGLVYTNPMVKEPEKNYWGDPARYYEEANLIFKSLARHHRDPNYLADLKIIEKFKPRGNLLDIGTNMGFFLRHAKGRQWNVVGIEPSPSLSEMARRYFGLNVKTTYLENAGFEDSFFDIVTMTDVFEHLPEPRHMLSLVRKVLKDDGIVFIKVPNGKYSMLKLGLAKIAGKTKDYDIFDSYEHIVHYAQESLSRMLQDCGFKVIKTYIGRPVQLPAWHKYVGHYYQYPSPWFLDAKNHVLRIVFHWISKAEFLLRLGKIGYFAPNIIVIAERDEKN